ncbi:NADAR family protein [Kribbella sp. CA-294648]|uniref:NADAR family protein n=1 Tax=Kribbella sp. CA-294648 TaxID=3239948 RepID=UPI003D8E007F
MGHVEPRSVGQLVEGMAAGRKYRYVFFWGHTPRRPGEVDASCFSQWYPAEFTVDGVTYPTAEHWMMTAKARLFGDIASAAKILAAGHPGEAKALGREVANFDGAEWRRERFAIVVAGNVSKFRQNAELAKYLAGTGDRVLVEASPVDRIWGTGLAADDERSTDPQQWLGENLLGFALMAARDQLD